MRPEETITEESGSYDRCSRWLVGFVACLPGGKTLLSTLKDLWMSRIDPLRYERVLLPIISKGMILVACVSEFWMTLAFKRSLPRLSVLRA
jgi:hypothetical protein